MSSHQAQQKTLADTAAAPKPTLTATLRIEYDLKGEHLRILQETVHNAIQNVIGAGALTGGTAAEVESYELQVRVV